MRKNQRGLSGATMVEKSFVTALQKGLDVLLAFGRAHPRLTVSEVARLTGSSPASARRSLLTLQTLGYLAYDGKHFWMLPKTLLVAHAYLTSRPTPSVAQPLLDSLSERTRESASIAQLLDNDSIIIARSTARRSLTAGLGIGSRLPGYCSATGRVLLASLPPADSRARVHGMKLVALTPHTVIRIEDVLTRIEACREDGYATSDEELELGVRSLAVPVFNRDGRTIAALSIAVRADRMSLSELKEAFLPTLRRAQGHLAQRLFGE